ncbi:hypothetical protein AB9E28_34755, partial [Rhizobium leguminosarum]
WEGSWPAPPPDMIATFDLSQSARDHKLVTLADPYLAIAPGDRISLTLRDPLYFDAAGQRLS